MGYTKAAAGESPVSVQVKIDKEQTFKTLSGDTPKLTLAEGTHTVVLKTVDAAGNESAPVTYKITVKAQSAVTTTPKILKKSQQRKKKKQNLVMKQRLCLSRVMENRNLPIRSQPNNFKAFCIKREGKRPLFFLSIKKKDA